MNQSVIQPNLLLVRPDIGKPKISSYTLPPIEHSYGKPYIKDKEGVKEITNEQWNYHEKSPEFRPNKDFKSLNKLILKEGVHSSKDLSNFKKTHYVPLIKKKLIINQVTGQVAQDPAVIYGQKSFQSTPMGQLIQFTFTDKNDQSLNDLYLQRQEELKKAKQISTKYQPKTTKSQNLLVHQNELKYFPSPILQNTTELYKMGCFKNVPSKISNIIRQQKTHSNEQNAINTLKN